MKKKIIDIDDVLTRALWTFLEAFFAVVLLGANSITNFATNTLDALLTLSLAVLIAAISAGLSALKTFAAGLISRKK